MLSTSGFQVHAEKLNYLPSMKSLETSHEVGEETDTKKVPQLFLYRRW